VPPEVRNEYRKRLSAGRKLARARRWGEAAVEFEKALQAIPMDGRALSELSWAALQAGDHPKAVRASTDAARVTADRKLRAASLYNLGRALEALGDRAGAAKQYKESLALRPHKDVAARLTKLGQKPPTAGAPPDVPCTAPLTQEALCKCLVSGDGEPTSEGDAESDEDSFEASCEILAEPAMPDRTAIAQVKESFSEYTFYLLVEGARGWSTAGTVAHLYEGGVAGVYNELAWEKVEERKVGRARLLWIETVEGGYDHDAGINESESHTTRLVTICVVGGAAALGCPLAVPLSYEFDRDILIEDDEEAMSAEDKKLHTPGLPIHRERHLAIRLAADGTATVTLVKGKADGDVKDLLGVHRLF
jgi:hypothetical protein